MTSTLDFLKDPQIFEVNREKAHSDHLFFETEDTSTQTLKQNLNGTWDFYYSETLESRPAEFFKDDFDISNFNKIQVPGHIQLQGYGKPQYVNMQYPWEGHEEIVPPQIPQKNPVANYVKYFDVEKALIGKETFICFEGVETAFFVWLNGNFVGYSEDSFTPAEFNLTPYLKEKNNKLAVEVYRYSTASWLEDQDFWRFFGIFRDVYLYAIPKVHLQDIKVITDYDYEKNVGIFSWDLQITNKTKISDFKIKIILKNENDEEIYFGNGTLGTVNLENIKPWSAEIPNLYNLEISILSKEENLIEKSICKVGFRRFEIKDGLMCLNGKRIIFKGVNRHEWNARSGRCISKEDMISDIILMKQNNINAVRTSHYPNNSYWYKLCDEYGIYLIDETNLETHGTWQMPGNLHPNINVPASLPEWNGAVLDRANSVFQRDKNHASVLIWSCGNESFCGDNIAQMANFFHSVDKTRLVHYEGVTWNRKYDYITDMESRMYAKPADIENYLQNNPAKPYISCEYMHAMGNSLGGMKLYTDLEEKFLTYQGGFIWDFIDQALWQKLDNNKEVLAYGGDFDDRQTDYGFCTNGIVYADRKPSPKMQEVRQLYSNIKMKIQNNKLIVKNENLFADTSDIEFKFVLENEGTFIAEKSFNLIVQAGQANEINIPQNMLKDNCNSEFVLTVYAQLKQDKKWALKGHQICFVQHIFPYSAEIKKCAANKKEVQIAYGDFAVGIHGKDFSMIFDRGKGGITSLVYDQKEYISVVPKVSFHRATTDNDTGCGFNRKSSQWQIAGKYSQLISSDFIENEQDGFIEAKYKFITPTTPSFEYLIIYKAYFDGKLEVQIEYAGMENAPEYFKDMPIFAIDFKLKKENCYFEFYGKGPEENYIDRNCGAKIGLFKSSAQENLSGYLNPQECGNRTDVRFVKVYDKNNLGIKFSATDKTFEMSVLPYSSYELENALHLQDLPEQNYTWVRIDAKQMGVGGDDSWGSPVHKEYKIDGTKPLEVKFIISKI